MKNAKDVDTEAWDRLMRSVEAARDAYVSVAKEAVFVDQCRDRVQELLESNNAYLARARCAEHWVSVSISAQRLFEHRAYVFEMAIDRLEDMLMRISSDDKAKDNIIRDAIAHIRTTRDEAGKNNWR